MSKFCGKCGSPIDQKTGRCPNCSKNAAVRSVKGKQKAPKKRERKTGARKKRASPAALTFGQKTKRFFLRFFISVLIIGILLIGIIAALSYFDVVDVPIISPTVDLIVDKFSHKSEAKKIETAFSEHNIEEINSLIFGVKKSELEQEAEEEFGIKFDDQSGNDTFNKDGFIARILEKTSVTVVKVEKSTVKYRISAPDMKGSLTDFDEYESQENLEKGLIDHISSAPMRETEVDVPFEKIDGNLVFNYRSEQFLDAVTGGFITEYSELYMLAVKRGASE